ncbi:hypothetical protein HU200_010405 [Digitaria exilis]|uniref:Uncharacterized protein n=1 Tax=Digitaria exilis TaxID=1010633 RepID=A0A835KNN5_9POAL|nr:hypothetical protein HU200_010405 [Digitaria exilis]
MMADCAYSMQVWNAFSSMGVAAQQLPPLDHHRFKHWWASMIQQHQAQPSSGIEQAVIYIAWNIWKERCRRVFDGKEFTVAQLILLIKQDISNWTTAYNIWEE